jgi:F0F1-type ATP synthase membrane subunit b/b'
LFAEGIKIIGEVTVMRDDRIQQVLEIEKQAQEIHEAAIREAEQLIKQADQEAQNLIEKAHADAQEEARRLVASAQAEEEIARILAETEEKVKRSRNLAKGNLDRAVGYVLDRVAGRE